MARPLRVEYPGAFYHVFNRGLERRKIFRDHKDYERFLDLCLKIHRAFKIILHAYALMPNHYHVYLETPEANLSRAMRQLDGLHTQCFNRRYKRAGPLFQGRYKAILVDKDTYSLQLVRYIHLNPVRAKLALRPEGYRWSSYRAFLGRDNAPRFLDTDWLLSQFSQSESSAKRFFQRFTLEGLAGGWEPAHEVRGGILLGQEAFRERIRETFLKGKKDRELAGLRTFQRAAPIDLDSFRATIVSLTRDAKLQRKLLVYALRTFTPLSLKEIGSRVGGMNDLSVAQAVFRLREQRKGNQTLNGLLATLEASSCNM